MENSKEVLLSNVEGVGLLVPIRCPDCAGEAKVAISELTGEQYPDSFFCFRCWAAAELDALRARVALLEKVAEAAIRYDDAIRLCADDPKKMASFCTATGDNLDALYLEWMTLARAAIAADAELTALRARVAQLDAVVEWACDELLRDENADPPSQYDTYAETAGDEAESWVVWLEAELRRRAGKEGK